MTRAEDDAIMSKPLNLPPEAQVMWSMWQARSLSETHTYPYRGERGRCVDCPPVGPCGSWWWAESYLAARKLSGEPSYGEPSWNERRWR